MRCWNTLRIMAKFLILIFLLFPTPTFAQTCAELFSKDNTTEYLADFIEDLDVKRRLFFQIKHSEEFKRFFNTFTYTLDSLYEEGFAQIVSGRRIKVVLDGKDLKEKILHQQIKILSLLGPSHLTREVQQDFIEILYKVYDPIVTEKELTQISKRLDQMLSKL
jgi:hypothetical protein